MEVKEAKVKSINNISNSNQIKYQISKSFVIIIVIDFVLKFKKKIFFLS